MPYIIDTKSPRATARTADGHMVALYERRATRGEHDYDIVSSRAVATIEEAREIAYELGRRDFDTLAGAITSAIDLNRTVDNLPETGGTIGPLPDGYVIDVRPVSWQELAALVYGPDCNGAHLPMWDSPGQHHEDVIDAYNDR